MKYIARPEIEKQIIETLESSDDLVFLAGPRGSGKTTLLRRLKAALGRTHRTALIQIEPIAASPEMLCGRFLELAKAVLATPAERSPSYDHLLTSLTSAKAGSILLLDELTELRTLSYFPGVKKPLEIFLKVLVGNKSSSCLSTSRFPFWLNQHLETLPQSISSHIRIFELPPLSARELEEGGADRPELIAAMTGGLPAHIYPFLDHMDDGLEPERALLYELGPRGRVEAECRAMLGELLHRARGYGACKAVLSILASEDNLTLSEIARKMKRTAGSTRDYIRWLEEVDLIKVEKKRYSITAPLLRLWLRIYGRGVPPSEVDIQNEVTAYMSGLGTQSAPATTVRRKGRQNKSKVETEKMIEID